MYKKLINEWVTLDGKLICFPDAETMFNEIVKRPGITMQDLHNMNYLSVFDALQTLITTERIFLDNHRYYPNN